ncbi:MAG TPA: response regulator transcription factor [Candidatus Caccovicinus merdipullorum]|uniref:Stage 0 sporulation protein A homolog n=1 Tax=Candidatus Caccovicinus merdipullorum TaxID=2840724 RepID=A0A9D1GMM6_9FIRM|nr:response regulator transcription factor [Candidatus Caccovicinus merdipullorum]
MRILIVEDNERLAESIRDILKHRYDCQICNDGETGACLLKDGNFDGAILDVMLPGKDGISIIRELRQNRNSMPVLMLSARSDTDNRVLGLESGADYYLTKPFDVSELVAVMGALTRRKGEVMPAVLTYGNISLNQGDFTLQGPEGSIRLGKKEYEIMRILMSSREIVIPKETLLLKVWGNEREAVENNVETHISFLRRKLEFLDADIEIRTLRKLGYRLAEKEMKMEAAGR